MNCVRTENLNLTTKVKPRTYKTEAVILKRINFSEADKILTLFSKHYGKVGAIAKGIRKLTSRKAASLELFNRTVVFLVKGRNLDIVTEAEVIDGFGEIRNDLLKTGFAYGLCELVDRLTVFEQVHGDIYNLLVKGLKEINRSEFEEKELLKFKLDLLEMTGFGFPKKDEKLIDDYIEEITEKKLNCNLLLKRVQEKVKIDLL